LYGQADPGGLINVVTKSPTSNPEYALQQGIGSYDFYRTEASASGPITPDASLRYRVDFSYLNGETFRDLSDNERIFVAPAFSWQVTPTTLVDLSYQHADDSLVYDSGTPAVGTGLADIPIERSFTQPGLVDDHQNDILEVNVTQAFSDRWKLSAGVTAFRNEKDFNEFYFFANLAPGDRLGDRYAWFGGEELTTYTAWGNLVGDFETGPIKHRLLLGLERFELSMDSEATDQYVDTIDIFAFDPAQSNVDVTPFEISGPDFIGNQDNTANAVYLQDQLTILENLHLMGGFRYDSIERELEAAYYSPLTVSSRDDSSVSPRAGIVYHPLPWLALYGSYAESFGPGFGYEASQLSDPETARQYEGGLKTELLGGRLTSTLAVYDLTKSNILTPDPNNPALSVAIGEARSRGVEIDVQASLSEGWSLVSTYAYTDTEILRDGSGNEGNVLPYAAPHQGSLWLKHDFQSNRLKGLSAGAGIYAAGKRYGDAANSYSDDAYARLDLFAAYRTKIGPSSLVAQVNINNVTDTEYYNLRARWSNLPAEPLTVLGTIRLEY
jgi:iron complex outermembrane receptor protein